MKDALRKRDDRLYSLAVRMARKITPNDRPNKEIKSVEVTLYESLINAFELSEGTNLDDYLFDLSQLEFIQDINIDLLLGYDNGFLSEPAPKMRYIGYGVNRPIGDFEDPRKRWIKRFVKFVKEECDFNFTWALTGKLSQLALIYPDDFRDLALQVREVYLHKLHNGSKREMFKKGIDLSGIDMEGNRTFIIKGDYIENHGQINKGPVQYNINTSYADNPAETYSSYTEKDPSKATKKSKAKKDFKEASKLADMIDTKMLDNYKKYFNEEIAPHIISDDHNPLTVVDIKFENSFKKVKIYTAFNIISNYFNGKYDKWDLAYYMKMHIANHMPKVESIYRRI